MSVKGIVVSIEHLPGLLVIACERAKLKHRPYQIIEHEPGLFQVVSGFRPWTDKVRAYIDQTGDVIVSEYARIRFGFRLPLPIGV